MWHSHARRCICCDVEEPRPGRDKLSILLGSFVRAAAVVCRTKICRPHAQTVVGTEYVVSLRGDLAEALVREVRSLDMTMDFLGADEYIALAAKEILHFIEV